MNLLGLALFTIQILLESYIFPNYPSEFITPKLFNILSLFITIYLIRNELRNQKSYIIFLVLIINAILKNYMFNYYYPTRPHYDIIFELVLSFSLAIAFAFNTQKDFEQFGESKIIRDLIKFFCSLLFANGTAFYLKIFTYNDIEHNGVLNFKFISKNFELILADFIILNGIFVICELINYSQKRDGSHIKNIFKYFVFSLIVSLIYFAIFNNTIAETIYDLLFAHVSKPYNIIIFNMFALPPIVKFKIAYAAIFYLL